METLEKIKNRVFSVRYGDKRFTIESIWHYLIYLWIPFGLMLAIFRILTLPCFMILNIILIRHLSFRGLLYRYYFFFLGFRVKISDADIEVLQKFKGVIVSNHIFESDAITFSFFTPIHVYVNAYNKTLVKVGNFLAHSITPASLNNVERMNKSDQINKEVLVFFAEAHVSRGEYLLPFMNSVAFNLNSNLLPVAIRVRNLFPITIKKLYNSREFPLRFLPKKNHMLYHSLMNNIFYTTFNPLFTYEVKLLPILKKEENESKNDYKDRVYEHMISHSHLKRCPENYHDDLAMILRHYHG